MLYIFLYRYIFVHLRGARLPLQNGIWPTWENPRTDFCRVLQHIQISSKSEQNWSNSLIISITWLFSCDYRPSWSKSPFLIFGKKFLLQNIGNGTMEQRIKFESIWFIIAKVIANFHFGRHLEFRRHFEKLADKKKYVSFILSSSTTYPNFSKIGDWQLGRFTCKSFCVYYTTNFTLYIICNNII